MTDFPLGVIAANTSLKDIAWHILGQTYTPKYLTDSSMAWHAVFPDGTFVPPHIHTTQDEFLFILTGEMECEIDGKTQKAKPGDLISLPRNIAHGLFNRSGAETTCLFWVSPSAKLWQLFSEIDGVPDPAEVVRIAAKYEVDFLPPPAN